MLQCWGFGSQGQLGTGTKDTLGDEAGEMGTNLPAVHLGGHDALQVRVGAFRRGSRIITPHIYALEKCTALSCISTKNHSGISVLLLGRLYDLYCDNFASGVPLQ